ncbi:MAG: hypothetical protein ACI9S8_002012 [Chlamydiales bacterium]|jgi:hypothetical protein
MVKQLIWSQRRVTNSALQFLIHSDEVQKTPKQSFTLSVDRVVEHLERASVCQKKVTNPYRPVVRSFGICKGIANRMMGRIRSKDLMETLHACERSLDKGVMEIGVLNKEVFSLGDLIGEYHEGVRAMKEHSLPVAEHFFQFLQSVNLLNYQTSVQLIKGEIARVESEKFSAGSLESRIDYYQALAPDLKLLKDLVKCNPERFPLEMSVNLRMYNQTIDRYRKTIHDINNDGIPVLETNLQTILFRKLLLERISISSISLINKKDSSFSFALVKS